MKYEYLLIKSDYNNYTNYANYANYTNYTNYTNFTLFKPQINDYDFSFRLLESTKKVAASNLKDQERHEML